MGYLHIDNLYKNQDILMFRECYALEKIHGTSAHISFEIITTFELDNPEVHNIKVDIKYFNGGENRERFLALFNQTELAEKFTTLGIKNKMILYGEAYGGKQQGMSHTYGKDLKFIVFDVIIGESWLDVPRAEEIVKALGLEFVSYERVSTDLSSLAIQRDLYSVQAVRNGITEPKPREGVVLHPIIELRKNNGARIIAKHKGEAFQETAKPRKVVSPEELEVLTKADEIAKEWVTPMRLNHIIGKMQNPQMENMWEIINSMVEDVQREGKGEIVWSDLVKKAIGKETSALFREHLKAQLK